ncbi:MAG: M48 family metalloprotease [Pseudomonadota bacterium]|nr:M48 family metalloprotease [Pseudomonadota bacterium]
MNRDKSSGQPASTSGIVRHPISRFRVTLLALLTLILATPAVVFSQNDALPDMGTASDNILSPQEEEQLGRQVVEQLHRQGVIVQDPLIAAYITDIGRQLAAYSGTNQGPFFFFVTRDQSINAFALPGGYVGVNAGLFLTSTNESELAGVLAHEIAHVTQRHIARRIEATRTANIATTAAVLAAILASSGDAQVTEAAISAGMAATTENAIRFTLQNEYEADRIGIRTLEEAGYNPSGMASFFKRLQQYNRLYESADSGFLRTHPVTSDRISEAQNRAANYGSSFEESSDAYLITKARLRVLTTRELTPVIAHFDEERQTTTGAQWQAATYGQALALKARGNNAAALPLLIALVEQAPTVPAYRLALAESQLSSREITESLDTYEKSLKLFPINYPLTLSYARALLDTGNAQKARDQLLQLPSDQPGHADRLRLLAQAAEALGQQADSQYYLAEYYLLQGQRSLAIEQLQISLTRADINEIQKARAQSRLNTLIDKPAPP